jgi:periplasmic protein TonB
VTEVRLPLVLSVAFHAVGLIMLVWLTARLPPIMRHQRAPPSPVAVIFEPPPPPIPDLAPLPPPIPDLEPLPPPLPKVELPPPPPPPIRAVERPRPRVHLRRPVERRPPPPAIAPPPQTAALPPPAAPVVTTGYRGALAEWFATHKRYPESARARGEEGQAVLRFRVARDGRVLSFSIARSTGHPDLDAAIEAMMRGAVLPPFPADMRAADVEVSVAVRFRLEQ